MSAHASERGLILAPQGRDAMVARDMLAEAGLGSDISGSMGALVDELAEGAGFAVVTEEALGGTDLRPLADWIEAQPEWSDFPFILLTLRGGGLERNPSASRYLDVLGNVNFLERPFHPTTLVSLAQSALRGRRRQYEARARLEDLNLWGADLERRVEERTALHAATVAQLHEAQKLETLGQLTGGVAHDFNNLLTPITGALDLLQRKYADQDKRSARLLANALQAADRAKTLLQRLLGFARRQTLQTQPVDLTELLSGMRDLIASSVGPTIEVSLRHDPDLPPALADPNQVELAVLNLCVNARDAMPSGGVLSLLLEKVAIDGRSEAGLGPGDYVRLSVIDRGCGMAADTLARAVEPFYSTKEMGRGTGLGLSMVHGLAAQLGGGFALSSEVGEGTRADLYLPVAGEELLAERAQAGEPARSDERCLSILVVDDEELVRIATAEMLRDLGHRVTEASGGPDALSRLGDGLEVDVVITDYKMPRMDGAELARRIRDSRPAMPVLLITGYTGAAEDVRDLPHLAKPYGQSDLAAALAELLGRDEKIIRFPGRARHSPG